MKVLRPHLRTSSTHWLEQHHHPSVSDCSLFPSTFIPTSTQLNGTSLNSLSYIVLPNTSRNFFYSQCGDSSMVYYFQDCYNVQCPVSHTFKKSTNKTSEKIFVPYPVVMIGRNILFSSRILIAIVSSLLYDLTNWLVYNFRSWWCWLFFVEHYRQTFFQSEGIVCY